MKLEERLKQIEKRIAELQRKSDSIRAELKPNIAPDVAEAIKQAEEGIKKAEDSINALPRRRGRKKLNETE